MNRREMIAGTGAVAGLLVLGAPSCGPSKEKAVRYTGLAIAYLKDVLPIVAAMGVGTAITDRINQAIPLLEKLKAALEANDFPTAGTLFDQITSALSAIATAVANLPDSPRKTTVLGIIALVNLTLRVIGAAVESETTVPPANLPANVRMAAGPNAIRRAFEATRF